MKFVMVEPRKLPAPHAVFLSGNDAGAKRTVREVLAGFGRKDVLDLGDIGTARATESYLPRWVTLYKALGTVRFNVGVVRQA